MLSLGQALHDALMRQEELLAYIDRQEEAKFRVSLLQHRLLVYIRYYSLRAKI